MRMPLRVAGAGSARRHDYNAFSLSAEIPAWPCARRIS